MPISVSSLILFRIILRILSICPFLCLCILSLCICVSFMFLLLFIFFLLLFLVLWLLRVCIFIRIASINGFKLDNAFLMRRIVNFFYPRFQIKYFGDDHFENILDVDRSRRTAVNEWSVHF